MVSWGRGEEWRELRRQLWIQAGPSARKHDRKRTGRMLLSLLEAVKQEGK